MSDVGKRLTPKDAPLHRVYLVDLQEPLIKLGTAIHNYCADNEGLFSTKDLLMMALNFLTVSGCVSEATEAMMIEIRVFQGDFETDDKVETEKKTEYAINVMQAEVLEFMQTMHEIFEANRFYGEDGHLQYTFGGWHDADPERKHIPDRHVKQVLHRARETYVPYFIPITHVKYYPKAISHVVQGEPQTKSGRRHPMGDNEERDLYLPF